MTQQKQERLSVTKVIGAPGTGKTTTMVGNPELEMDGLFVQNSEEYSFDEQMLVTYTNAGVDEAASRLATLLDMRKDRIDDRVMTIHGFCYRNEDVNWPQVVKWQDEKSFCEGVGLEYGNDDDDGDIMTSEGESGNKLLQIYRWLQSNRMEIADADECPIDWDVPRDLKDLLRQWTMYKHENDLIGYGDMIQNVVEKNINFLREGDVGDPSIEDDREYLHSCIEDDDLNPTLIDNAIRGEHGFVDAKVLYVDECQDLDKLQWDWYLCQKLAVEKVYLGGDDDQCLPPWETVDTPHGEKRIDEVEVGDEVATSLSDGEVGFREVTGTGRIKYDTDNRCLLEFVTETGRSFTVTDNHKMIARTPRTDEDPNIERHFVYLMIDDNRRVRVGTTNDLRSRMNLERTARSIIPLSSHESREDALVEEEIVSLSYGIPTQTFTEREGEVLSTRADDLYRGVTNTPGGYDLNRLAQDFHIDMENPPYVKKATTRGRTKTVNINIKMLADTRSRPIHEMTVYTSNRDVRPEIETVDEVSKQERRGGDSIKYRFTSTDLKKVGSVAREVKDKLQNVGVNGNIVTYMSPTESQDKFLVTPAGNVEEGFFVPVDSQEGITEEQIVSVNTVHEEPEYVYDVQVEGTHNFTTNGVAVHNTIYEWSGADPNQLLDEEGELQVLETTYRLPPEVWNTCESIIEQVDDRVYKDVEPVDKEGEVHTLQRPLKSTVMDHIRESDDVMILFRTRYHIDEFRNALHDAGIPYTNMSTFKTWTRDTTKMRDVIAKLRNGDPIGQDDAEYLIESADDNFVSYQHTDMAKDQISGMTMPEDMAEVFNMYGGWRSDRMVQNLDDDEFNWFKRKALEGNLMQGDTDADPDNVRIGTIHSAKGMEADTVIAATDTVDTIVNNMPEYPHKIADGERRVMYVACSRAERKLVLVQNMIQDQTPALDIRQLIGQ